MFQTWWFATTYRSDARRPGIFCSQLTRSMRIPRHRAMDMRRDELKIGFDDDDDDDDDL